MKGNLTHLVKNKLKETWYKFIKIKINKLI